MFSLKNALSAVMVCAVACALAPSAAPESVPADSAPDFVPLGAYLSWERAPALAKYCGVDTWVDVARRLDALQANHVNLLWVTNMSSADLPRLASECERRAIRLLPCIDAVEVKVDWRWADDGTYYKNTLESIVKQAGDSKAIIGWVLSDEPLEQHFERLETLRLRLRALDPARFCTSVLMWGEAPKVIEKANLPVVCVDLYPFFGPDDPNGPHTDGSSQGFFRSNTLKLMKALEGRPAVGWVMGMCFSDIWGPRKYNEQGHLIGLPGAYLHWRAPTLAEMRWQVWESLRAGGKGFICYTLAPETPDPATATAPPPDVEWKNVLAKEETDLGPNALTNPDASATPQLEELGRAYATIAPHAALIRRWTKLAEPAVQVDAPAQAQTFADPQSDKRYAIVVNDNLKEAATVTLRLDASVASIADLARGGAIAITAGSPAGSPATATLALAAGEGTILSLEKKE